MRGRQVCRRLAKGSSSVKTFHVEQSKTLTFTVDQPISKKNKMRRGMHGNIYKAPEIEAFEGEVFIKSHNAVVEQRWKQTPNAVAVRIQYRRGAGKEDQAQILICELDHEPNKKRRKDLQNLPDVILDVLQRSGVYFDDQQVERLIVEEVNDL